MNLPPWRFSVGTKHRQQADADDVSRDTRELTGTDDAGPGLLPTQRVVRADAEVIDDAPIDERIRGDAVVGPGLIDGGAVAEVADADVRVELLEIVVAGLRVERVGPQRRAGAGGAEKIVDVADRAAPLRRVEAEQRRAAPGPTRLRRDVIAHEVDDVG